jgi:hypothetical protein
MSNQPEYRDQSKLEYLPPFNDTTVERIDKISLLAAALVGLFGILYFSLAPAAMSTDVSISSIKLSDGFNCKMIASITRIVEMFSYGSTKGTLSILDSQEKISNFNSQISSIANSQVMSKLLVKNHLMHSGTKPWWFIFDVLNPEAQGNRLRYENSHFDTYDDCIAAARTQTTCRLQGEEIDNNSYAGGWSVQIPACKTFIHCSSFKGKLEYAHNAQVSVNRTALQDPALGKCNNQAQVSTCTNINSNCQSLQSFLASYEEIFRKNMFTPELLCKPFLENPPYICTKAVPPSVPSILSQSFAFTTTALAAVKTFLFFAMKMFHKHKKVEPNVSKEMSQLGPVANAVTPVTIPSSNVLP